MLSFLLKGDCMTICFCLSQLNDIFKKFLSEICVISKTSVLHCFSIYCYIIVGNQHTQRFLSPFPDKIIEQDINMFFPPAVRLYITPLLSKMQRQKYALFRGKGIAAAFLQKLVNLQHDPTGFTVQASIIFFARA